MPHALIWMCLAAAAVIVVLAHATHIRAQRQLDWRRVGGRVLRSEVRWDGELYAPEVTYEYSYNDAKFTSSKIRSGLLSFNWRGPAERLCERYRANSAIQVLVNPADPTDAVLEPAGGAGFVALAYVIAAIFVIVSLAFIGKTA
jgi:hypothetical protein